MTPFFLKTAWTPSEMKRVYKPNLVSRFRERRSFIYADRYQPAQAAYPETPPNLFGH